MYVNRFESHLLRVLRIINGVKRNFLIQYSLCYCFVNGIKHGQFVHTTQTHIHIKHTPPTFGNNSVRQPEKLKVFRYRCYQNGILSVLSRHSTRLYHKRSREFSVCSQKKKLCLVSISNFFQTEKKNSEFSHSN